MKRKRSATNELERHREVVQSLKEEVRQRIVTVQSMQDEEPCELTYVTTKREARDVLAERARYSRIIADQGVWIVAFLMRFSVYPGTAKYVEFTPEEMDAAGMRLSEGPLHVARSRDGGMRLSLEPFDELVGSGNGVDHAGDGVGVVEGEGSDAPGDGDGEAGPALEELNDADVRPKPDEAVS